MKHAIWITAFFAGTLSIISCGNTNSNNSEIDSTHADTLNLQPPRNDMGPDKGTIIDSTPVKDSSSLHGLTDSAQKMTLKPNI